MGDVTYEQVNLMLRLYDIRREPRLREAREWFVAHFAPTSIDDMSRITPMGSKEHASLRMVISYWEMVASIVNRGLIDEDIFFENSGEQWYVWERLKPVAATMRERYKNPAAYAQLEEHARRFEAWREKRSPGSTEIMRQMMRQQQASHSKAVN